VLRIWREHLRPRLPLLMLASLAMILTAATTGAIPFLIQKTADDVFVAKNQQMVYWVTAAIVVVTVIKAIAEYIGDVTVNYLGKPVHRRSPHPDVRQACPRRSELHPDRAFGTAAFRLSQ
jgi:ABC-type multidrug transport system fused ATPase/permease subunit